MRAPLATPDGPRPVAAHTVVASPFGPLHVAATAAGVCAVEFRTTDDAFPVAVGRRIRGDVVPAGEAPAGAGDLLDAAREQLVEFTAGRRTAFDLPLDLRGSSAWDRRVLDGVRTIPFGTTASYGEVARRIGAAGAARAVGSAVGRNPVGLLVPCHRVIAGDGTLGGYGGSWFGSREELLDLKRALLEHEGVTPPPPSPAR